MRIYFLDQSFAEIRHGPNGSTLIWDRY